ncbi:hypothetical protein [Mycobacterium riyadhense]|nr:hypothetical protein [Mycobacterium riyadhense]MCV7145513.1 hypothetical protein [Mycobacterium riyadhense]
MAFREVGVNEIKEVLRVWLGVAGLPAPGYRTIAAHCGYLGMLTDGEDGRRRKVYALIFTAV